MKTVEFFEISYFDSDYNYITEAYETYADVTKRINDEVSDEFAITKVVITFNGKVTTTREEIELIRLI